MSLRRVSDDWLLAEPFWYEFEQRGLQVTAIDVPMTLPSRLKRGIEILNWGSHDQISSFGCNNPGVAKEVQRRFGLHPMGAEIPVNKTATELRRIRDRLVEGAQRKGELIRWMLEARPWDFFIAVFGETHRGGHLLWPERDLTASILPEDALLDVYRAVDAALAKVIPAVEATGASLVVFALHGMGPNRSQEHFVPRVMDRLRGGAPLEDRSDTPAGQRSLMRTLRERVPAAWQNAVAQVVPVSVRDWVVTRQISSGYDWSRTTCFPLLADSNGYLRWNVRGREREGILDESGAEAAAAKARLHSVWQNLRVLPSGSPLVADVVDGASAFPGSRSGFLPDLIITWAPEEPASAIESEDIGLVEASLSTGRGGNHRDTGFVSSLADAESIVEVESIQDLSKLATMVMQHC